MYIKRPNEIDAGIFILWPAMTDLSTMSHISVGEITGIRPASE